MFGLIINYLITFVSHFSFIVEYPLIVKYAGLEYKKIHKWKGLSWITRRITQRSFLLRTKTQGLGVGVEPESRSPHDMTECGRVFSVKTRCEVTQVTVAQSFNFDLYPPHKCSVL